MIPPICVLFVEMRPKARPELQIGNAIGRWDCGLKVSQSQKENLKFSFENRTTEQKYFCISFLVSKRGQIKDIMPHYHAN